MAQIKKRWSLSFALSAENWAENKWAVPFGSCPVFGLVSALGGALQRCSYPPHKCLQSTIFPIYPFAKGTSLLCRKGDISTLH
jgi:hypothetical protein